MAHSFFPRRPWIGVLVSALFTAGCGGRLTSTQQVVYKPEIRDAGTVGTVSYSDSGAQQFGVSNGELRLTLAILPTNRGAEYVLSVVAAYVPDEVVEIESVKFDLARPASPSRSDRNTFELRPVFDAPRENVRSAPEGVSKSWMQEYRIIPDIRPAVDRELSLTVDIQYQDKEGDTKELQVTIPLVPKKIKIPSSLV